MFLCIVSVNLHDWLNLQLNFDWENLYNRCLRDSNSTRSTLFVVSGFDGLYIIVAGCDKLIVDGMEHEKRLQLPKPF